MQFQIISVNLLPNKTSARISDLNRSLMECVQEEKLSIWQSMETKVPITLRAELLILTAGPQCMLTDTRDINVEKCQTQVQSHCSKLEGFQKCSPDCFSSEIPC